MQQVFAEPLSYVRVYAGGAGVPPSQRLHLSLHSVSIQTPQGGLSFLSGNA